MSIELFVACRNGKPVPQEDVCFLEVTDPVKGLEDVEFVMSVDGYHSHMVIRAKSCGDVIAVLEDKLTELNFDANQELTVAFFSDCLTVSTADVVCLAHTLMRDVTMETESGDSITDFNIQASPVIDDVFENGAMAALDGISEDSNPHACGTNDFDNWNAGYQSNTVQEDDDDDSGSDEQEVRRAA